MQKKRSRKCSEEHNKKRGKKFNGKLLSFIICMTLVAAMAFAVTGCGGSAARKNDSAVESNLQSGDSGQAEDVVQAENSIRTEDSVQAEDIAQTEDNVRTESDVQVEYNAQTEDATQPEANVLGIGDTEFTLTVTDKDGTATQFEIHTDKETVGEALTELGLIEGEESEYGLYVKTVNGITADYDTDGVYWAFYIDGEYASTGVDSTTITSGESYAFKVE